jgi:hypothetical protein
VKPRACSAAASPGARSSTKHAAVPAPASPAASSVAESSARVAASESATRPPMWQMPPSITENVQPCSRLAAS